MLNRALQLNIRGFTYSVILLSEDEFTEQHGPDTDAICRMDPHELVFKSTCINKRVIVHELTHSYINGSLLSSSDMSASQMEEVLCELMGYFIDEMVRLTEVIFEYLNNQLKHV